MDEETTEKRSEVRLEEIVALCKRRGFIFPSSEIYGGVGSTYDYGHYGVLLSNNVKDAWWRAMLHRARRHRRARLGDHPAPARLGGLRPRRRLHRPDGRLQDLQGALPRRQARGRPVRQEALEAPGRGPRLRADRGARVQPDVQDARSGPVDETGSDGLPAPGDGAGDLHQLQERAAVRAPEAAVRHRPDRQVASATRSRPATSSSARASSSRWRWSSSARPDEAEQWYEHWMRRADALVHRPRHPAREPAACARTTPTSSPLLHGHLRHRVPVPDGLLGARGDRQPRRLRPHPARRVQRREARVLRPAERRALRPARDRARRRRRPRDARLPGRRLRTEEVEGRQRTVLQPAPEARADQGRRPAAGQQGGHGRAGARDLRLAQAPDRRRVRRQAARSASATAARTRSARPGASRSTAQTARTTPSPCATATRSSRAGSRSRAWPRCCSRASTSPGRARSPSCTGS